MTLRSSQKQILYLDGHILLSFYTLTDELGQSPARGRCVSLRFSEWNIAVAVREIGTRTGTRYNYMTLGKLLKSDVDNWSFLFWLLFGAQTSIWSSLTFFKVWSILCDMPQHDIPQNCGRVVPPISLVLHESKSKCKSTALYTKEWQLHNYIVRLGGLISDHHTKMGSTALQLQFEQSKSVLFTVFEGALKSSLKCLLTFNSALFMQIQIPYSFFNPVLFLQF